MAVNDSTSIPSGRSKNNMKEAKVKEINKKELESLIGKDNPFEIIGMMVSFKDNVKTRDDEITEVSSKGKKVYSEVEMNDNDKVSVLSKKVCFIAPEQESAISKAIEKNKKKRREELKRREETEARKVEEFYQKEDNNSK